MYTTNAEIENGSEFYKELVIIIKVNMFLDVEHISLQPGSSPQPPEGLSRHTCNIVRIWKQVYVTLFFFLIKNMKYRVFIKYCVFP